MDSKLEADWPVENCQIVQFPRRRRVRRLIGDAFERNCLGVTPGDRRNVSTWWYGLEKLGTGAWERCVCCAS